MSKDEKDQEYESLLYKTIQRIDRNEKRRFRMNLVVVGVVLLLVGAVAFLVIQYAAEKYQERKAQEVELAQAVRAKEERDRIINSDAVREIIAIVDTTDGFGEVERDSINKNLAFLRANLDSLLVHETKDLSDTVFVWTPPGLVLRDNPVRAESKIIRGYPYGTALQLLYPTDTVLHTETLFRTFEVDGYYVKMQGDSSVGFAFTGLTSQLPFFYSATTIDQYMNLLSKYEELSDRLGIEYERTDQSMSVRSTGLTKGDILLLFRRVFGIDKAQKDGNAQFVIENGDWLIKLPTAEIRIADNVVGGRQSGVVASVTLAN
ncbi:MAG: hypothetical protein AAFY36_17900 [Bacteroidota bacterium]